MRLTTMLRLRLRSLFRSASVDRELDEELRYHLERDVEALVAAGVPEAQARRTVRRTLAGYQQRKEECRDMRGLNVFEYLQQDARFALRQLRRRPGFTATATITLALGICASVAIFTFVDAALIKPLPYAQASRLVGVFEVSPQFPRSNLSYLDYLDWKRMNTVFSSLAVYQGTGLALLTPQGTERVGAARVSDDFFRTLGVTPVSGRDFRNGEDLPGSPRLVLLSYGAWQNRFGGRRMLGETISLNGEPHSVIGVLPREFSFAPVGDAELWTTVDAKGGCEVRRSCHNIYGVGRLSDGVSMATAAGDVARIAADLERQYPDSNRDQGAALAPLAEVIVGPVRPILLVLLGGAGLLLLIAVLNVSGLLLVRSESRRRELAVRSALGASSSRVFWQFATEALVLVALGASAGLMLASSAIRLLFQLIPASVSSRMAYLQDLGLNGRGVAFAVLVSMAAAVLFTVTPLVHLWWSGYRDGVASSARGSAGLTWRRLGARLVVLELATAMVLLVGAGLLGQSLYRLLNEDIGLRPEHLATLRVGAPASYTTNPQMVALGKRVLDRVASLPGVTAVGLSSTPPLAGGNTMWIRVIGRPYGGEHNEVNYREISTGYFDTLGARLVRGRHFSGQDTGSSKSVVIVNQALVARYFPGEDPIGRELQYAPTSQQPPMEIVGIVADIKEGAVDSATPPTVYVAFDQDPTDSFAVVARTTQSEDSVLLSLSGAVRDVDPLITTSFVRSMSSLLNESQPAYLRRVAAVLVGSFAAVAWLMGAIGLYGVIAYSVSQRTREIGVRMALGAEQRSVSRLVLREAGWLTAAGIAIGLVLSIGAATLMRDLLFGVRSWDLSTLMAVAIALGLSSLLASYIPARRAAAVNPVDALRAE